MEYFTFANSNGTFDEGYLKLNFINLIWFRYENNVNDSFKWAFGLICNLDEPFD